MIHEMPVCKIDSQVCKSDLEKDNTKNFVLYLPVRKRVCLSTTMPVLLLTCSISVCVCLSARLSVCLSLSLSLCKHFGVLCVHVCQCLCPCVFVHTHTLDSVMNHSNATHLPAYTNSYTHIHTHTHNGRRPS